MTVDEMYSALDLPSNAGISDVKRAYRSIAKRSHPDLAGNDDRRDEFERAQIAYEALLKKLSPAATLRRHRIDLISMGLLLARGKTVALRVAAARTFGQSGRKASYAFLRKALYDPSEEVVVAAVRAIGALRIAQAGGELAALFSHSTVQVKTEILAVAELMTDRPQFSAIAVAGMSDEDRTIRRRSVRLYSLQKRTV